ncbi:hypothetical protein QUC31_009455 [Theobroma cacao]
MPFVEAHPLMIPLRLVALLTQSLLLFSKWELFDLSSKVIFLQLLLYEWIPLLSRELPNNRKPPGVGCVRGRVREEGAVGGKAKGNEPGGDEGRAKGRARGRSAGKPGGNKVWAVMFIKG